MTKLAVVLDVSNLQIVERDFPLVCKFCLIDNCDTCEFSPERNALIQELQQGHERTIEQWEKEDS
jgi:hypothetical protein